MNLKKTETAVNFYAEAARSRTAGSVREAAAPPELAHDYRPDALVSVPEDAVNASFGCGDPLAFSAVRPGQTVLDLGCGAGLDLILAAEKVGSQGRVIGVDASSEMLGLAAANVNRSGLSDVIELREGIIEELPVADASVDWVISNCVINLSSRKRHVFEEIHRVLRPGGMVLVADLVADELPDWVTLHTDLYAACVSGAVSENTYLGLAREAGLREPEVVHRMNYDETMVRALIVDALPIAVDEVAQRLQMSTNDLLDMAARDLAGRITSIKLQAQRAADPVQSPG